MAKVIDLDTKLGFLAPTDDPQHIKVVKILGIEVRVICDLNAMALSAMLAEGAAQGEVLAFMRSLIHPDDWALFTRTANNHPALRGDEGADNMYKVLQALTEQAAERPTVRPSDSPRGGSPRSTTPKSAASSSARPAAASKRSRSATS